MEKHPDDIYNRILSNRPYHYDLDLYNEKDIKYCIDFFIKHEEYEKCHFLTNWIKDRKDFNKNWSELLNDEALTLFLKTDDE